MRRFPMGRHSGDVWTAWRTDACRLIAGRGPLVCRASITSATCPAHDSCGALLRGRSIHSATDRAAAVSPSVQDDPSAGIAAVVSVLRAAATACCLRVEGARSREGRRRRRSSGTWSDQQAAAADEVANVLTSFRPARTALSGLHGPDASRSCGNVSRV